MDSKTEPNDEKFKISANSFWKESDQLRILRSMKEKELQLQNFHITWMSTIHTLIIIAISSMWGKGNTTIIFIGLSTLAIIISILTFMSVLYSNKGINRINNTWKELHKNDKYSPELHGYEIKKLTEYRITPWESLPIILGISWTLMLFFIIFQYKQADIIENYKHYTIELQKTLKSNYRGY